MERRRGWHPRRAQGPHSQQSPWGVAQGLSYVLQGGDREGTPGASAENGPPGATQCHCCCSSVVIFPAAALRLQGRPCDGVGGARFRDGARGEGRRRLRGPALDTAQGRASAGAGTMKLGLSVSSPS